MSWGWFLCLGLCRLGTKGGKGLCLVNWLGIGALDVVWLMRGLWHEEMARNRRQG